MDPDGINRKDPKEGQLILHSAYLGKRHVFLCGGLPKPQNRPSYLGEIRRICFVEACPNPKIVLSWRDRHVFLCGGLPKPQNRPISAR